MKRNKTLILPLLALGLFSSCDMVEDFERRAAQIERFEKVSLYLAKENRELKAQLSGLQSQLQTYKSEKNYLEGQLAKYDKSKSRSRGIASVPPMSVKNDLVQYEVYKWSPAQMLAMAEKEFSGKNFEKSAQFFQQYLHQYPNDKKINDEFLFKAGVAAFESGSHHDWTLKNLNQLVSKYPTSKLYRGAKLWMALTYLKQGHEDKFFHTVEEFRKKYRNTDEWEILSHHYETIVQKYKRN